MERLNDKDHAETLKRCKELHKFLADQGDDDIEDEFTEVWLALDVLVKPD